MQPLYWNGCGRRRAGHPRWPDLPGRSVSRRRCCGPSLWVCCRSCPVLGAFIIWVPAAGVLRPAGQLAECNHPRRLGSGCHLHVDNILYPIMDRAATQASQRRRLHLCGRRHLLLSDSRVILGPLAVTVTLFLSGNVARARSACRPSTRADRSGRRAPSPPLSHSSPPSPPSRPPRPPSPLPLSLLPPPPSSPLLSSGPPPPPPFGPRWYGYGGWFSAPPVLGRLRPEIFTQRASFIFGAEQTRAAAVPE